MVNCASCATSSLAKAAVLAGILAGVGAAFFAQACTTAVQQWVASGEFLQADLDHYQVHHW